MKWLAAVSAGIALHGLLSSGALAQTAYSHGDPTDEEQLYLEFINRARANIDVEATRLAESDDPQVVNSIDFFNVDLEMMVTQFAELRDNGAGSVPATGLTQMPLAFNADLIEASRLHSQDMLISVFQGHNSSSNALGPNQFNDSAGTRATRQGYQFAGINENVYASARSVWHGHAAFNIDWGNGPGGIQNPAGHRNAIHHPERREAGVGVIFGNRDAEEVPEGTSYGSGSSLFSDVGPQLVTQLFGRQQSSTGRDAPFLTGVIYADIDGDAFYSLNEGLAGLQIEVDGADFYATTSTSGGYAIPLPNAAATYTVTLSGPNMTTQNAEVTVPENLHNVKWDFSPSFTLPTLAGSASLTSGNATSFNFGSFPGATAYRVRLSSLDNGDWAHGAEIGESEVLTELSSGTMANGDAYNGLQSGLVQNGNRAFYLVHFGGTDQIITFTDQILPSQTSELRFQSRLGWSVVTEIAEVQVSADGGQSWQPVYSQEGYNPAGQTLTNSGEDSFQLRTADLSAFAGQVIQLRLNYRSTGSFAGGQGNLDNLTGWVVDSLTITNSQTLDESVLSEIGTTTFDFTPPADGPYLLEAAAVNVSRVFPFGPPLAVSASGGGGSGGALAQAISGEVVFRNEENVELYFAGAGSFSDPTHANWRFIRPFGAFNVAHFPWIYHAQLGFIYVFGPGGDDLYTYLPDLDAVAYSNIRNYFPYFYDFTNGHWWYFYAAGSTAQSRHYFSFNPNPESASGFDGWVSFGEPAE